MKKIILLLFIGTSSTLFAQQSDFWKKVQFGGGFSLGLGSQTTLGISPNAIYNFDNGFALGTGLSYLYANIEETTTSVYGVSILSFYQIPKIDLQLSSEFDYNFASQKNNFERITTNFPALHLGLAYNKGRFAVGVRYDVLYDKNKSFFASPISPIVRFYF